MDRQVNRNFLKYIPYYDRENWKIESRGSTVLDEEEVVVLEKIKKTLCQVFFSQFPCIDDTESLDLGMVKNYNAYRSALLKLDPEMVKNCLDAICFLISMDTEKAQQNVIDYKCDLFAVRGAKISDKEREKIRQETEPYQIFSVMVAAVTSQAKKARCNFVNFYSNEQLEIIKEQLASGKMSVVQHSMFAEFSKETKIVNSFPFLQPFVKYEQHRLIPETYKFASLMQRRRAFNEQEKVNQSVAPIVYREPTYFKSSNRRSGLYDA